MNFFPNNLIKIGWYFILLIRISQKHNVATPSPNTQDWIKFGKHLVSYDDAVMHVAMLMDRCTKWSWCLPLIPNKKVKLMHPLWNPCRPQSLLCIPLHPLSCPLLCCSWSTLIWGCISCASFPFEMFSLQNHGRPLVYFVLPDYRNSDQIYNLQI